MKYLFACVLLLLAACQPALSGGQELPGTLIGAENSTEGQQASYTAQLVDADGVPTIQVVFTQQDGAAFENVIVAYEFVERPGQIPLSDDDRTALNTQLSELSNQNDSRITYPTNGQPEVSLSVPLENLGSDQIVLYHISAVGQETSFGAGGMFLLQDNRFYPL
jgi:hypothetical protein